MGSSCSGTGAAQTDHDNGFLPEAVWIGTRSYIEKIAKQINGCYEFEFFDGAAVIARRIVETLLIECYEHLQIADRIKKQTENIRCSATLLRAQ